MMSKYNAEFIFNYYNCPQMLTNEIIVIYTISFCATQVEVLAYLVKSTKPRGNYPNVTVEINGS